MAVTRLGQLIGELRYSGEFISQVGTGAPGAPSYSTTKARTGSYSYRGGLSENNRIGVAFPAQTYIRAGFWINHNGIHASANNVRLITLQAQPDLGAATRVRWVKATGLLELYVFGILQDSVSVATVGFNTFDTWMHIGFTYKAHASAGFVTVYLNGVPILNWTGNTGTSIESFYAMGADGSNDVWDNYIYLDDFYVDSLTDEADAAPPSKRFLMAVVNGAGANAQWTPSAGANYQNVDDIPPDDETTHNRTLLDAQRDTFQASNITVPLDYVIRASIPVVIARKLDAGSDMSIKVHTFDGGTYQDSGEKTLTTTYQVLFDRQPLQPDGTAWNEADFNGMQVGYSSSA